MKKQVANYSAPTNPTQTFTRQYAYDGQDILIEYDGDGNPLAHYTHSTLGSDDVLQVEVSQQGQVEELAQAAGDYEYLKDSLGSIIDVTDTAGNRLQHYIYSAYGTLLGIQNGAGTDVTANPPLRTSFSFTGRELDSESGLLYYRARYYDPTIGRFLQHDPQPGTLNVPSTVVNSYVYASNNPFNITDPSGQSVLGVILGVILIAVAIVVAAVAIIAIAAIATAVGGAIGGALGGGVLGGLAGGAAGGAVGGLIGGVIGSSAGSLAGGLIGGGAYLVGGRLSLMSLNPTLFQLNTFSSPVQTLYKSAPLLRPNPLILNRKYVVRFL